MPADEPVPCPLAGLTAEIHVNRKASELSRHPERADPAQGLENENVVDQDICVHGGHTSRPSAVKQRCSQAGSDPLALPSVLDQYSQFDDSCGTDSESGHSHAGCVRPGKQSLAVWPSPKQCRKVGHTISEPMEPVKQAGT
jgi:hypothetical protein